MSGLSKLVEFGTYIERIKANLWDNRNVHGYIDSDISEGLNALGNALARGDFQIAEYLLENGANINYQIRDGVTLLMYFSARGEHRIVEFLLKNNADVSIKANGFTASDCAHDEKILKLLNSHKKKSNSDNDLGSNYAVINGTRYSLVKSNGDTQ